MAVIKSLIHDTSRKIQSRNEMFAADYNADSEFFSIWSYKKGDMQRLGDCSQNMQFDKEMAKILRDALNVFLKD